MEKQRLTYGEARLMELIWDNAPLPSGRLTELCLEELGWKKSTTYTMLKKLEEKGYARNERGTVSAQVSRASAQEAESRYVVENRFAGSLPGFLAAFFGGRTISAEEAENLKRLIDAHREN